MNVTKAFEALSVALLAPVPVHGATPHRALAGEFLFCGVQHGRSCFRHSYTGRALWLSKDGGLLVECANGTVYRAAGGEWVAVGTR